MAAIHSNDTKPKMVVHRYLRGRGFSYRLNAAIRNIAIH